MNFAQREIVSLSNGTSGSNVWIVCGLKFLGSLCSMIQIFFLVLFFFSTLFTRKFSLAFDGLRKNLEISNATENYSGALQGRERSSARA